MTIELIIIGDEILNGRTVDANLAWLAPWLFKRGLKLDYVSVVGDNPSDIVAAFETAWKRSTIILTSGGIGPTQDDLTKSMLAQFSGKSLIESAVAKAVIEDNYTRFGREWTPKTNSYHVIPEGFIATKNPNGLAPGLVFIDQGKAIMAAPGVPKEFAAMVEQVFFPLLADKGFNLIGDIAQVVIRTYGVPEEKIFGELCPNLWQQLEKFGKVSSLPHLTGVDILVTFEGQENHPLHEKQIKEIVNAGPIKQNVWQWGKLSLEEYIINQARKQGATIALAESCTGGLVASKLTDIAGSSDVFLGSAVTYANSAKEKFIGVSSKTLERFGAVSEEVALEMAIGAKKEFGSDFAISFSGIAGPGGGTEAKPVGLVCQGFASNEKTLSRHLNFRGDRVKLKERFAYSGLFWLLENLF